MINQIAMPKGILAVKDISSAEFDELLVRWKDALESVAGDGQSKIMVIGGHEVEYISFEDKALKLWQELFNAIGHNPFVDDTTDYCKKSVCYFCSEIKPNHKKDCVYIRARNLLEERHG